MNRRRFLACMIGSATTASLVAAEGGHHSTAMFAIPPGVQSGGYVGETLVR